MNGDVCVSPKGEILNTFLEYRKWTGAFRRKGERNRQPRLDRQVCEKDSESAPWLPEVPQVQSL